MSDEKYIDAFPRALLESVLCRRRARMVMFRDEPEGSEITHQEVRALMQSEYGRYSFFGPLEFLFGIPVKIVEDGGISG